jgi:hypothetical protein
LENPKRVYYYPRAPKLRRSTSACEKHALYIGDSKDNHEEGLREKGEGYKLAPLGGRLPSR